ncbi:hypothetical protein [Fluviispira sanaruensis]|uniref:Lipoprotein n=1 Tax=Fluviispira sanaruensis TaxID=2493639 RepID=A0A4P2VKM9_FLUSA|nr:hypothetical protein [Fluviispira sanaruensis]BBH51849.1 hypothetical protein JCM31447_02720 [Fluviispira sanaruensis]
MNQFLKTAFVSISLLAITGCGTKVIDQTAEEKSSFKYNFKLSSAEERDLKYSIAITLSCMGDVFTKELNNNDMSLSIPKDTVCQISVTKITLTDKEETKEYVSNGNADITFNILYNADKISIDLIRAGKVGYKDHTQKNLLQINPIVDKNEVIFEIERNNLDDIYISMEPEIQISPKFMNFEPVNINCLFNFTLTKLSNKDSIDKFTLRADLNDETRKLFKDNCKIIYENMPDQSSQITNFITSSNLGDYYLTEAAYNAAPTACSSAIALNNFGNWNEFSNQKVYFIFKTSQDGYNSYNTIRFLKN